jgi:hypothetical protein
MAKGETIMPVPQGNITTTEILVPEVVQEVVPVVEEVVEDSTTLEEASDSTPE